jgi:4-amino-4-deoxy-L-arabinose transferase-like glycosyltransferase
VDRVSRLWWRSGLAAGLATVLLYAANLIYCQRSVLQLLDSAAVNSDMHANLLWAESITEQGWLNPRPYHPRTDWMSSVAPYSQWVQWWGGEQVFQQSPLYAYLLSFFVYNHILMRILQALISIFTCVAIGLFTARIAGQRAGWIAFWLSILYAPFYLYSWPFLRDGLGWFLTAAVLWALAELSDSDWASRRAAWLSWITGVLLGLGLLAKESFRLLIAVVIVTLVCLAWKRQRWINIAWIVLAMSFAISPLIVRNWIVDAPLLSSSNRFAETFVEGNAATASPYRAIIPLETAAILYKTQGRTLPLIRATVASHQNGIRGWVWLQVLKLASLLDPYESPDNLSFYFVAHFSPLVRFGLRYWMILPLGLAGLVLGIWKRQKAQLWVWIFLSVTVATLLVGIPLSRYRQSLMVLLIPCAAFFMTCLCDWIRDRDFWKVSATAFGLLAGWGLILGPFARQPRDQYERASEYILVARIYHGLGDDQKALAMIEFIRQKFPGVLQ